jgi:hypothetical protein
VRSYKVYPSRNAVIEAAAGEGGVRFSVREMRPPSWSHKQPSASIAGPPSPSWRVVEAFELATPLVGGEYSAGRVAGRLPRWSAMAPLPPPCSGAIPARIRQSAPSQDAALPLCSVPLGLARTRSPRRVRATLRGHPRGGGRPVPGRVSR